MFILPKVNARFQGAFIPHAPIPELKEFGHSPGRVALRQLKAALWNMPGSVLLSMHRGGDQINLTMKPTDTTWLAINPEHDKTISEIYHRESGLKCLWKFYSWKEPFHVFFTRVQESVTAMVKLYKPS